MLDINIKDIRVLPGSLDLKNNADKSMSEILGQLQSGSVVKGLVVGTTPKEAIFHTAYGRFAAKNNINLVRGDTISLKLVHGNTDISGTIISVNNKKPDSAEALKLNLSNSNKQVSVTNKPTNAVNISTIGNIPKTINGEISYLNLSKTNKDTPLFRALNSVTMPEATKIAISLNVVSSKQSSNSAFIVLGEVAGNTKDSNQLIKTSFGVILSTKTNMPIGQKLTLEITSINNQSITQTINNGISDFLFSANKNWQILKNLVRVTHGKKNIQATQSTKPSSAPSTKNRPAPLTAQKENINSLIRNLGTHEEIRKLSSELINLKELILPSIKEGETPEKWQTIFIPFHNGEQVENYQVKIDRSSKNFLRFLIDVNLVDNPMQIDGLIRFENDNKTPINFDLTVKSKNPLDPVIKSRITNIYQINQNVSGVRGNLSIE